MSIQKKIIDISQYQPNINYKELAKDVDGVIIRIGYRGWGAAGTLSKDSQFEKHIKGVVENNIPYGFYFFSQAKDEAEGKSEADYAYNLIKKYKPTYPVYIDSESSGAPNNSGRADNISKEDRTAALVAFCKRIKELGLKPGVYASENWFYNQVNFNAIKGYSIWCAKYGTNNGTAQTKPDLQVYDGWQFTSVYTVKGIDSKVDMSYFYKDFKSSETATTKEEVKKVTYKTYYANDKTGVNYRATPNGELKGTYAYAAEIKTVVGSDKKAGDYTWLKTDKGYWVAKSLLSTAKPKIEQCPFKVNNNYTLLVDLKVRTGAGTNYSQKRYASLTADGKKNAYQQSVAVLKRGTIVTVQEVIKKSSREYWAKIPSGYIALMYNGKKYVN